MRKPYAHLQILPGITRVFYTEQEYLRALPRHQGCYVIHPAWGVALLLVVLVGGFTAYLYF
jgi:hypothetical protein